jgi:hypothetical protein
LLARWAQTTSRLPWLLLLLMCVVSLQNSRFVALLDDTWQKTAFQ